MLYSNLNRNSRPRRANPFTLYASMHYCHHLSGGCQCAGPAQGAVSEPVSHVLATGVDCIGQETLGQRFPSPRGNAQFVEDSSCTQRPRQNVHDGSERMASPRAAPMSLSLMSESRTAVAALIWARALVSERLQSRTCRQQGFLLYTSAAMG